MNFKNIIKMLYRKIGFCYTLKIQNNFIYVFNQRQERWQKMINFKFNKKGTKKNKDSGITLIALVITVIVLLILARN